MGLRGHGRRDKTDASTAQCQMVELAEAYMRAHVDSPVSLSALCRLVVSLLGLDPARKRVVREPSEDLAADNSHG